MLRVVILIVSTAVPCLSQTLSPSGPNVCSRVATRYKQVSYSTTVTLYRKGYRRCGASTCTDNKAYTVTRQDYRQERESYNQYLCCQGYAYSGITRTCQPVCNPACLHGNCTGPDTCSCDPRFTGDTCQYATCSSIQVTKVCYPGTCAVVNNKHACECSANFTGPLCLKLNETTQQPSVAKCSVSFRLDGTANLWASPKPCEAGQVYVNVTTLAAVKLDLTAAYSPNLASPPTGVTYSLGITGVEATFRHHFGSANTTDSRSSRVVGFPASFTDTQVFNLSTTFQLNHNSSLLLTLNSTNGGYRSFTAPSATNQSYSGTSGEHDVEVTIDHVRPRHCSDLPGTCSLPKIGLTHNATYIAKDRHVLSFPGWSDDVSGIESFTYSILSGSRPLSGTWLPSLPEPYFSRHPDVGYEIQLTVTDHAGNAATARLSLAGSKQKIINTAAIVGGTAAGAVVVIAAVALMVGLACWGYRRRSTANRNEDHELRGIPRPKDPDCDIQYEELSELSPLETFGVEPKFAVFWEANLTPGNKKTRVVIKQLKEQLQEEAGVMREKVRFLRQLAPHLNVLKFIGAVRMPEGPDAPSMVLEFCTKGNLEVWLKQQKQKFISDQFGDNDLNTLITIADGVAKGLQHLHKEEMTHGKLKCSNVLLTVCPPSPDIVAKITGFGPQRMQTTGDRPAVPLRWMSPEFLRTEEVTSKTDVWNFGTFLFELFSLGEKPWPDLGHVEVKDAILGRRPMEKPEPMDEQMNNTIMQPCFKEADQRPDMGNISEQFDVLYAHLGRPDEDYLTWDMVPQASVDPDYLVPEPRAPPRAPPRVPPRPPRSS